ncbi:hypothetical protein SHIRM173S_06398 [Streptomyces hirsutus]
MRPDRRRQERRAGDRDLLDRPEWGYGLPDATTDKAKLPLHVQGGASFDPDEIDSYEIVTFDGEKLVEVDA